MKVRSSFFWMATPSSPPLTVPVRRTISAVHTILLAARGFSLQLLGLPPSLSYQEFTTPYSGLAQVIRPNGQDDSMGQTQQRFGLYRWHIMDPIRFEKDIKVTIQALGWRSGGRYLPLQDDISSVAFWYQTEPHAPFPKLPEKDYLEIQ